ncbi:putative O-glycosylation ligase, exosortase A system-associated [Neptunomonas marina]|uniref:Putative O-glycosylation ligase, exosortase A system-associated n=1 Tax=Neptunomonas marina TaxID=1815562 RepID=A0A437Q886_9GAMM|nr:putative O-glycosylation ligase, exosortase A system-associated [Neptunomonas marina]RVU30752.1 putative O-glycosylation ligase, exosortase A system-associated [Neptunomonas marina]
MRDLVVLFLVFGSLPFIFKRPYLGIIVWAWLSYMNPHRLAYGFAYNMPFAQIVALVLIIALVMTKDRQKIPVNGLVITWVFFLIWMGLTSLFALDSAAAKIQYVKVLKIQFLTFLTIILINSYEKMKMLIWIIVLSLAFFSVKGGIFTILSGGAHRVWGPPGSFIEENNSLALATLMMVPLMYYLYATEKHKWIKRGLLMGIPLSLASAIGSQSRGALLATISVAGFFWLKSKSKVLTGTLIVILGMVGFTFMPESWHERMSTIQTYDEDASAMGRIGAWIYSINAANSRITGAGFDSWSESTYAMFSPDAVSISAAHSIYFSVLADHGWIGLLLYLTILFITWRSLSKVLNLTNNNVDLTDQNLLARMLQVSFIAYFTGGAFLSLSYFDLPWHLIVITLLLKQFVEKVVREDPTSQPGLARRGVYT